LKHIFYGKIVSYIYRAELHICAPMSGEKQKYPSEEKILTGYKQITAENLPYKISVGEYIKFDVENEGKVEAKVDRIVCNLLEIECYLDYEVEKNINKESLERMKKEIEESRKENELRYEQNRSEHKK
jgi:hypothetical protein